MLNFEEILENIFSAVVVIRVLESSPGNLEDFEFLYSNNKAKSIIKGIEKKGVLFSQIKDLSNPSIPWFDIIAKNKTNEISYETAFFSAHTKTWFRGNSNKLTEDTFVITFTNITTERSYSAKLRKSFMTDSLTGLPNRFAFIESLEMTLDTSSYENKFAAILILDIDNMKTVNDSKGFEEGDKHIKFVASILSNFQRSTNIRTFRYGDDEFIVLISDLDTKDSITTITDTIYEAFQQNKINVTGGIAVFPDDSPQKDELLKFADMALHFAKKHGKNNFYMFDEDMHRIFKKEVSIQTRLTAAILESSFTMYYQPQFDITTGDLRGFEALIRWSDEELGNVSPAEFIPIAENSDMIFPIGTWVINTALETLKRWQTNYNFSGIMSINISPCQLNRENFICELQDLINKHQVDPRFLELEITEGVLINNMNSAITKLQQIKDMGIRISLDDFGTGYSSLNYLQALPLNTLKIDKSFINGITNSNGVQANITSAIINMVTNMGLETIAEGVEKEEQVNVLRNFHCNAIQGYLRGMPMPLDKCEAYIKGDTSALLKL